MAWDYLKKIHCIKKKNKKELRIKTLDVDVQKDNRRERKIEEIEG